MSNTESRPLAWLCELAQEDGTTRQQIVAEDPDGLRWNDMGEPSPFRVTPLYARAALAQQPAASGEPTTQHTEAVNHAHELLRRQGYHRDGDYFINVNRRGAEAMHVTTIATIVQAALIVAGAAPQPAPARVPLTDDPWHKLYRRAINEANGLTNYVEDRPELRSAERRLTAIEAEARTLAAAATPAQGEPK